MNFKMCNGSICSDGQSPSSVSSGSCSASNGSNDFSLPLPGSSHNLQLLQSKIDVLNATLAHEKFRFAQEYKDMQGSTSGCQVQRQDSDEGVQQLRNTISDLHQLLADHMARSSSENEELRTSNANLQQQLSDQKAGSNLKEIVVKLEKRAVIAEEKVEELAKRQEELSKKYIEHSVLSSLHAELQKEMATFKRLETMRADKVIEEYKNKMSQMLENSDNSPNTSENGPSDLNAEYNSFSRESLENVVKTLKQKLADLEKENLFLKVEDANKQNSLYLVKKS
uniref:Uncharacterized protein n=1 Tax=Ditylenchus dipsaci TaxID=166011 RepID=A0A915DFH6_9BILA